MALDPPDQNLVHLLHRAVEMLAEVIQNHAVRAALPEYAPGQGQEQLVLIKKVLENHPPAELCPAFHGDILAPVGADHIVGFPHMVLTDQDFADLLTLPGLQLFLIHLGQIGAVQASALILRLFTVVIRQRRQKPCPKHRIQIRLSHKLFQEGRLGVLPYALLQKLPAGDQPQHGMLRADLVAALQKLRLIHHRNLDAAHIQIAVSIGVLEDKDKTVGKYRNISAALLQGEGLLLRQLFIAENHVLHPGIPALNTVGAQNPRENHSRLAVDHILVNHMIVDHRQAAVNPGF